jgi:hypothetical protein
MPIGAPAAGSRSRPKGPDKPRFPVKLDHVDEMGAFFRFDSSLLRDEDFRASFPQQCLLCGASRPLSVHVIFWSSKMQASAQAKAIPSQPRQVYTLRMVSDLSGRNLLDVLDPIEQLPEPYNLPFPYYVCSRCSALGVILTDVHQTPDGQNEVCELGISSLPQAEQFCIAVCGEGSEAHQQIRKAIVDGSGRPWQQLPLTVRIRINRWYQAREGERFLAYFTDAEFSKAEAGLAGAVLTDLRLIFHKSIGHMEIPWSSPITIESKVNASGGTNLTIIAPDGKKVVLHTNPANAKQLQDLIAKTGKS